MAYDHGGDVYGFEKQLIDFSANVNPFGMPESAKSAIIKNLDKYHAYPDPFCRKLTEETAKYYNINKKHIIFGNGAGDIIYRLVLSYKPKSALLIAPTFSEYEKALILTGCKIDYYILDSELKIKEDILNMIEDKDIIFICNPNNPTGITCDEKLMDKISTKAEKEKSLLVIDECFLDFTGQKEKSLINTADKNKHLFILKAFTKFFGMAGLRLGYGICGNEKIIEDIRFTLQPWSVSSAAQDAGIAALNDKEYQEKTINYIKKQRDYLKSELKNIGLKVYDSETNYILFYVEDENLKEKLLEHNILIRDCSNYKGLKTGFYRIAVKHEEDNKKLVDALKYIFR